MALQRLTKRGLEDMRRDPLAGALVQSAQMLLLASVVALCVAIPFGYPAELVAVAGVMGVGAGGAGTGWAVRSGMLNSIRNPRRLHLWFSDEPSPKLPKRRERAIGDGGEQE